MSPKSKKLVIQQVKDEQLQGPSTRQLLYGKIETKVGLPVISYFTSPIYYALIEDADADMLEAILQKSDLSGGFALLLNSLGGMALTAERIINICRSYSGTGEYQVIVPGKAKSAATMICLGASKIIMGNTSELGTVDPQLVLTEEKQTRWFSVYNVVKSYKNLFDKAVNEKGNLQPYLQQLANYDARDIAEYERELELSVDISVSALQTGMLKHLSEDDIKKKIEVFLSPETVKTHGRPIYAKGVVGCGLNVEVRNLKDNIWPTIHELYIRLKNYVSTGKIAKCIESKDYSYTFRARED